MEKETEQEKDLREQTEIQQKIDKEYKERLKAIAFWSPFIIGAILCIPALAFYENWSDARKAKKHPNVVTEKVGDYIILQDVKDGQKRAVSKNALGLDTAAVQLFYVGDTVHFYGSGYNTDRVYEQGRIYYDKNKIRQRREMLKLQNIKNGYQR